MIKILLIIVVLVFAALLALALSSRSGRAPGLADGRLAPCPAKPNCVNSEYPADEAHYVAPLALESVAPGQAWQTLQKAIRDSGGEIVELTENYLAARYRTALLGFTDDIEARLAADDGVIHLRSASRVGYGDMGVNRKRVERIRRLYEETP